MAKVLFLFLLFFFRPALAFWVGNPSNPTFFQQGIISSKKNGVSVRVGYLSDFTYNAKFKEEFVIHINFEEREMFPFILELNAVIENPARRDQFTEKYPSFSVSSFEKEHSNMDDKMDDLTNIIIKYLPPNYDQNRGNAFLSNLFLFEKDLKNHSRIEDHILIPKVKQLEKLLVSDE